MDNYLQTFAEVIRLVTFQFNPQRRVRRPTEDGYGYDLEGRSRSDRDGWPRPRR